MNLVLDILVLNLKPILLLLVLNSYCTYTLYNMNYTFWELELVYNFRIQELYM